MEFKIQLKNFEVPGDIKTEFYDHLNALNRSLRNYAHYEKEGYIMIEKLPNQRYQAKVHLNLPHHHIEAEATGFTPQTAFHEVADRARDQVLKLKDSHKDYHLLWQKGS